MGSDATGKTVVGREQDAAGLAQELLRSEAEERAEELEMLDSQSGPAAQDVADDPVAEAEHALGLALGDSGVGEALLQDLDDGGFERAVPNNLQGDLRKAALTDGRPGDDGVDDSAKAGARPAPGRAA